MTAPTCFDVSPNGRDLARVEALLAELYALGERPARTTVASFMEERWPEQSPTWRHRILELWVKRLRSPHHVPRSVSCDFAYPWAYPFVVPELLAKRNNVAEPGVRLQRVLQTV